MTVRTRLAPSPTGYPHIGSIWQAWIDRAFSAKYNGQFIVRIEDTDRERFVPDAEEKLYQAFDWFGISEDESPRKGGPHAPYRQSERLPTYQDIAKQLVAQGNAYYCFCSLERLAQAREEMQKSGKPPMYDKHCRNLSKEEVEQRLAAGEPWVIRLKVPENRTIVVKDLLRGEIRFDSNAVDDQVLIKSDGFATYHLAAITDDHLMRITHVVRGEEWLPSAPKHQLIYEFMGWEVPVLVHTPTLRNPDKTKLSKRKGHTNVDWFIEQGFLPDALINFLSQLGWTHPEGKEIFNREEFIRLFELKDLSPVGPVFDEKKLRWMNGKYIREKLTDEQLFEQVKPFVTLPVADEQLKLAIPLIKERMEVLSDVNELLKFINPDVKVDIEEVKKQSKQPPERIKELLEAVKAEISRPEYWQAGDFSTTAKKMNDTLAALKVEVFSDFSNREFFMTIRVAATGFTVTPPLFESILILGKDVVVYRLDSVISQL